ncbi:NAD(P)-dependent alcohol dehydrogenase [Nonomuraea sp. NPDC052634]|uniref:NAD(P)-dependent alcohol dehydrogenase n=1 Tax=Nonomuraea sp. NPDC052634 TaxID=3155813 RepID=UPI0034327143
MRTTTAWRSTGDGSVTLERVTIERRDLRDHDIALRVDYCGVCHSDLHRVKGMLKEGAIVPGHEFTGTVTAVGPAVTRFAPGDRVAVGTIVDSCGKCAMCEIGQENYCLEGPTSTYGAKDRVDGTKNQGGYSREFVVTERFAYHLPDGLDPAGAAPLLCAGITTWEPLRAAGVGKGTKVAVAGLGGLGHLGVKLAVALGAEVTVLSRTPDKAGDARALGACDLLVTTDEAQVAAARYRFDVILDTVPIEHDLTPYISMVALDGTLSILGYPLPDHGCDHGADARPQEAHRVRHRRHPADRRAAGVRRPAPGHRRHRGAAVQPRRGGAPPPGQQRRPLPLRPRPVRPRPARRLTTAVARTAWCAA